MKAILSFLAVLMFRVLVAEVQAHGGGLATCAYRHMRTGLIPEARLSWQRGDASIVGI